MRAAGLAIAVKNARAEVKQEAQYVTPHAGGDGALRDAVEFILKAQGKWKKVLEAYLGPEKSGKKPLAIGSYSTSSYWYVRLMPPRILIAKDAELNPLAHRFLVCAKS